jgi:uncharacterized membrane protein (DUF106 family)
VNALLTSKQPKVYMGRFKTFTKRYMFNRNVKGYREREEGWLKRKASTLAISVLLGSILVCLAFVSVLGDTPEPTISSVNPPSGIAGSIVNVQGTIGTANGSYLLYLGSQLVQNAAASEFVVNTNFAVPNISAGEYNLTLQDATTNQSVTTSFTVVAASGFSAIPLSTFAIMAVAIAVAFINSGINRALVSHFVGWSQYKSMQREMAEWRAQQMAAVRANDKKQLEKLKKKESQIMNMQKQMLKPQMILFGFSFVYIIVWIFVLTPTYGATTVAYLPGFDNINVANFLVFGKHGAMGVFYWYPICSFLFGTLASRIMGILPID